MRAITRLVAVAALAPLWLAVSPGPAGSASSTGFAPINGSGSSFAAVAIDVWSQAVRPRGLVVNYNPDGSDAGRVDYTANQDDFAVSDEPFRTSPDKLAGLGPEHPDLGFSYIPGPASGVALLYHLTVHGQPITDLRLSGSTVMKIFTGQITNWDNPQITRDYGRRLANLPIIPVIHSDLAGSTLYFTSWLAAAFPSQWNAFCVRVHPGLRPPCGPTVGYPAFGRAKAENGSNNVAGYITSPTANGAIGYDEVPYALGHIPELKLGNAAGDFVAPTAAGMTTSLSRAIIDSNPRSRHFLQVDLAPVYASKDPANYPLSFASYLIVPRMGTRLPANFTLAKGRSLSTFLVFALCGGQQHLPQIGYARLPANLDKGGLLQVAHIPVTSMSRPSAAGPVRGKGHRTGPRVPARRPDRTQQRLRSDTPLIYRTGV